MIILDTSALIYWTLDQEKITTAARQAIEQSDHLLASSISIWEIAIRVKKNKLEIPLSVEEYTARLMKVDRLDFLAVDVPSWLASVALDWENRDPADRVIVATSTLHDCSLITSDRQIAKFYSKTIW